MADNMGLSLIHEAETSGDGAHDLAVDIVFVHGLNGHPYNTWTAQESGVFWPRDLLPKSLPNFRVLTFGYQSRLADFTASSSFSSVAESLLEKLAQQRGHDQKNNPKLIFVAHSLGGLIVEQALLLASDSLHDSHHKILDATSGIVFFGTPHRGSSNDIARVLQYSVSIGVRAKGLNTRSNSLVEFSSQLGHIQEAFQEFHTRKLPKFHITSFFEELPLPGFGLVVNERSAIPSSFTSLPIHANHETICKFSNPSESNYQRVLGELKKLVHTEVEKRSAHNFRQGLQGLQEALRWLKVGNGSGRANSVAPDTCKWVFDHKDFTSWVKEDHNSILWITGKPGTGKSTLLSHIIQNLEDRTVEIPRTTVASFFFNEPQDTTYTTAGSLLQSFVFQILSQIPSAMSDFIPLLSQQRDFFTTLDESGDKWRPWTSKNLNGLFENYLIKISETHRLCFFVDALDECPEEDSSGILSLLSSIDSSLLKNPIKLCITSRPHRYLEASYRPRHRRIILENENTADIQRFIRFRIAQFPKRKREELILNEILEKASGVFLWAKIVVDVLKHLKGTIEMLESSLWDIPSDLGGLYRFVLDRFIYDEHRSADLAKRLLKLVCYARRPLSVEEMSHALGVDASLQVIRSDSSGAAVNSEPALLAVDKNWLLAHCWGLVEVREPGVKIHLVHQTIREYLVNTVSVETGWEEDPKCHTFRSADIDLAEICLSYLSFDAYTGRIDGKSIQKEADGLLDYATDYWHEHARLADHRDSSNMVLLKLLNWPSTKVLGHWAHLHQKKVGNGTPSDYWGWTVLHASAAFGLHNLALAIRDVERSDLMRWDVGDAVGRTPLSLAAKKGDLSLVKLFLDAGSSIATRDIGHGFSPLLWAASQGHQKVVELLLQEGADADDNVGGTTALLLAAGGGHGAALEALLDKGANPNLADKRYGWTPLHLSAGYGDEAVVSLLLAHGADPNLVNPFTKRMPLYYATAGGHQEVVRLLLDHGGGMQQPTLGPVPTIPIFWADRVACSFLIPLDSDPSCQPSACTSSKTNVTSSPDGSAILRQTGDNSKKASKKRLRDVSESGSGGGLGGSGNDPNKHPTLNPTPSLSSNGPGLRLACPYHKYDPGRYGSQKPCRGPVGWPSINRVKEHLYKHHFVQVCQRCYLIFEDQQGLENHYKAPTPCSARLERDYGDGFDDNQWKQLKARTSKREFKGNELEYWKGVYRILFPGVEMSAIPSPFYEEENITKKSYDESCARARTQDPLLRSQILQLIHDPMQADPVGSLFDLINRHQEISVSSVATGHDGASLGISGTSQLENSGGFLNHQPPPLGGPSFNLDWPPCPQMPVPWLLPQSSFQADSGFYSTSSAGTEGDGLSLPPQPAEFGYLPADLLNVQNPVEGQNIPISTPDPMAAMADLPEHIDLDKLLSTWDANTARVSGVSRGRSSSADRADEEE